MLCSTLRSGRFPKGRPTEPRLFPNAVLNIPVWDWGTLHSKLKQAEYKQQSAKAQLTLAQRTEVSELYANYNEATTPGPTWRRRGRRRNLPRKVSVWRICGIRRGAPATDVIDAETTLVTARNAYADAQARYRRSWRISRRYWKFLKRSKKQWQQINGSESMHFPSMNHRVWALLGARERQFWALLGARRKKRVGQPPVLWRFSWLRASCFGMLDQGGGRRTPTVTVQVDAAEKEAIQRKVIADAACTRAIRRRSCRRSLAGQKILRGSRQQGESRAIAGGA